MIEVIDLKIKTLLGYRDHEDVLKHPHLRATICTLIEKAYFLQSIILNKKTFKESKNEQFYSANSAVNRHFRDWGLDEVANIYNDLAVIAAQYLRK